MPKTVQRQHETAKVSPKVRSKWPKFRKASPNEIKRSLAEYHALLDEMKKLNIPPFDAAKEQRQMKGEKR